jgi:hypothetical protein
VTDTPLSTEFLAKNVKQLRNALDHHNATCSGQPKAFVLHPYDRRLLPFDELWGVPLVEDPKRRTKGFGISCPLHDASANEHPPLSGPSPS